MKKTKSEDMTLKQRRWLKAYLECGNAKKAAMQVYDCTEESAGQIGYENLKKLDFAELLEEGGITDVLLHQKIKEGLDATRTTNAVILITKGGKVEKAEEQGLIEVADSAVRHKYLETTLKLKRRGLEDSNQDNPTIQVNIHPEFLKKYGDI